MRFFRVVLEAMFVTWLLPIVLIVAAWVLHKLFTLGFFAAADVLEAVFN